MEFKVIEENGIVVGFDLEPQGQSEDEAFCRELPRALLLSVAKISITEDGIVIENSQCSNRFIDGLPCRYSFGIPPHTRERLKALLGSDDTQPVASLMEAFGPTFQARFRNERLENIEKTRYPGDKHRKEKQKIKKRRKRH